MSFWGTLAKFAADAAGSFVGDPMLGHQVGGVAEGLFGGGGNMATDLSQATGGMAQARANNRIAQGDLAIRRGGLAKDIYNASLGAKSLENTLDSKNYDAAIKGLLAKNMQDVTVDVPDSLKGHLTTFSGGLRPSAIGPEGRALGANMAHFKASQIGNENLPAAPALPDIPDANVLDDILNASSAGSGLFGIIQKYLPKKGGGGFAGIPNLGAIDPAMIGGKSDPLEGFWDGLD
jgi:hypothetical protein